MSKSKDRSILSHRDPVLSIYKTIQDKQILFGRWPPLTCVTNFTKIVGSYLLESFLLASFY